MFRFSYTSWKWRFLGKTILQGSVATRLRCGGIVSNHLTTNFLQNPPVKEFRKSVMQLMLYPDYDDDELSDLDASSLDFLSNLDTHVNDLENISG